MKTIDIHHLSTVTGGIVEGGCVVPDPWLTGVAERLRNLKTPQPKGQPTDLTNIGTTRPK